MKPHSDWVTNNISALQGAHVTAKVEINFDEITTRTKNALIKALQTNILPAETGQINTLYNIFYRQYRWHPPHVWGKGKYWGKRLLLTQEQYDQIRPYFLLQGYELNRTHYYQYDHTSVYNAYAPVKAGSKSTYNSDNIPKTAKPQAIDELLIKWDIRNNMIVDNAIKTVERGDSIYFEGEI